MHKTATKQSNKWLERKRKHHYRFIISVTLNVKMHLSNFAASHIWHALNYMDET